MHDFYIQAAKEACAYVHQACPFGSANRANGDNWGCKSQALKILGKAKEDFYEQVEQIQKEFEKPEYKIIELLRKIALGAQAGNCQELAAVAFIYLKERGIQPIEMVSFKGHTFVVIGRDPKTPIDTPEEWNLEAVICDPWRRQIKLREGLFTRKDSMVFSAQRLAQKMNVEQRRTISVGYGEYGEIRTERLKSAAPSH